MRYPSHTCRNRRHSLNPRHFQWLPSTDRASSWSLSIFHTPLGSLDNHMCMNTSSPLRHMPSGSSPLRYPVTSTSNSYSSSSHFFILQPYHTRCFFLHSSPSFASLRRWRLLEGKVEKRLRKFPSLTDAGAVRSASDSAIPCAYIRGFACFLIEPACCDDTVIGIEAVTILSEAVEISDE